MQAKTAPAARRTSHEVALRSLRPDVRARLEKAIAALDPKLAVSLEDVIVREREKAHGKSA